MLYFKLLNELIHNFTDVFSIFLVFLFPVIIFLYVIFFYRIFTNPYSRVASKIAISISALVFCITLLICAIILSKLKGPTGATLMLASIPTYATAYGILAYLTTWAVAYIIEYSLQIKKSMYFYKKGSFLLLLTALLILIGIGLLAYQIGLQANTQMINIKTINS